MNRQSCHFVKQIFCGGYFFHLVFTCTPPQTCFFSFLSCSLPLTSSGSFFPLTGCSCLATQPLDYGESRQWLCAPHSGRCAWGVLPCVEHRLKQVARSKMSPSPSGWLASGMWHSHWLTQTYLTARWRPGSGKAEKRRRKDEIRLN